MEEYIQSLARPINMGKIIDVIGIDDSYLKSKVEEAMSTYLFNVY